MSRKHTGFTLIELMVVVAVLALMTTLAAPSFTAILASLRVRTTAYNLIGDLSLARSEAVKRSVEVTITPISSSWNNGWTVTSAARPATTADPVGFPAATISRQASVGNGVQFVSPPGTVIFGVDGRSSSATVVKFTVSDGVARHTCISLDPTGTPKSTSKVCT